MLKILMWAAIVIAAGIGGILIYAATLSDTFAVSRTVSIKAPPEKVFPLIDDLREMNTWNPFAKQDPSIKINYSGKSSGPGASYTWTSSGQAGQGKLTLTDHIVPQRIDMILDMEKPIEGHNSIVFTLTPRDGGVDVTWSMTGGRPYIGKVLGTVFSMEKMVGGPFEQGLRDLKTRAEKP